MRAQQLKFTEIPVVFKAVFIGTAKRQLFSSFSDSSDVSPLKLINPTEALGDTIKDEEILEKAMNKENEVQHNTQLIPIAQRLFYLPPLLRRELKG